MRFIILLLLSFTANAADLGITTINASYHFNRDKEYKESGHNGVGLQLKLEDGAVIGAVRYTNSFNEGAEIYYLGQQGQYFGFVAGFAKGYRQSTILLGATAKYKYVKFIITPVVAAVGLDIPVNF